ncbi:MAG: hypothetical protein K9N05_03490, partial [Candidatus Marinimicrobia bacterium]|nr:hypothetical protein [Candidatus Neomarinimicrobiota bacterium]
MKRSFLFSIMLMFLFGCSSEPVPQLDIIPVQFLFSGDSSNIAVQDMFYSEDYSALSLKDQPGIEANFSAGNNELTLYADKDFSGYTTLPFLFNNKHYDLPVKVVERKYITFTYVPESEVKNVSVFGNFNFWLRNQLMMEKNTEGIFSITIPFEPGQYEYLFAVDGREILDPSNPLSVPNGLGGFNSPLKVVPNFSGTRPFLTPKDYTTGNELELNFIIIPNDYKGDIALNGMIALIDNHRLPPSRIKVSEEIVSLRIPETLAQNSRRIRLVWTSDITTSNLSEVILENGVPAGNGGQFKWQDAIIY